mgnify:CR=1 FL=1
MEPCALPAAVLAVAVLVDEEDAEGSAAWPAVVGATPCAGPTAVPVGVPPRGSAEGTLPGEVSSFCGAFEAE